jgi:hypothetical protein
MRLVDTRFEPSNTLQTLWPMDSRSESSDVLRAYSTIRKASGRATKVEGQRGEKKTNNDDVRASFTNTDHELPRWIQRHCMRPTREEISTHGKTFTKGETIPFTLTLCSLT